MNRQRFALITAADALEGHSWYLEDILADYNDPENPVTVGEVVAIVRKAADEDMEAKR